MSRCNILPFVFYVFLWLVDQSFFPSCEVFPSPSLPIRAACCCLASRPLPENTKNTKLNWKPIHDEVPVYKPNSIGFSICHSRVWAVVAYGLFQNLHQLDRNLEAIKPLSHRPEFRQLMVGSRRIEIASKDLEFPLCDFYWEMEPAEEAKCGGLFSVASLCNGAELFHVSKLLISESAPPWCALKPSCTRKWQVINGRRVQHLENLGRVSTPASDQVDWRGVILKRGGHGFYLRLRCYLTVARQSTGDHRRRELIALVGREVICSWFWGLYKIATEYNPKDVPLNRSSARDGLDSTIVCRKACRHCGQYMVWRLIVSLHIDSANTVTDERSCKDSWPRASYTSYLLQGLASRDIFRISLDRFTRIDSERRLGQNTMQEIEKGNISHRSAGRAIAGGIFSPDCLNARILTDLRYLSLSRPFPDSTSQIPTSHNSYSYTFILDLGSVVRFADRFCWTIVMRLLCRVGGTGGLEHYTTMFSNNQGRNGAEYFSEHWMGRYFQSIGVVASIEASVRIEEVKNIERATKKDWSCETCIALPLGQQAIYPDWMPTRRPLSYTYLPKKIANEIHLLLGIDVLVEVYGVPVEHCRQDRDLNKLNRSPVEDDKAAITSGQFLGRESRVEEKESRCGRRQSESTRYLPRDHASWEWAMWAGYDTERLRPTNQSITISVNK
ncbi:hypothetical protein MBM_05241 [Drepanopeziza brunnea f. sp. 'multigermtubi' MB_m1]|uniref:Uncharacterized protein n=1 Tax=Marssonina brunnea f. sp. multigermtubi (strain MB_m1) TaxID=1072389 RepID=K1WWB7_MARBU|nr:uncharacterized protein MBM_05241 [Drepanopeziza brunnea f. sp. 'multigermtubi' MB_m1]EKD16772.1 hypothetical protein MBM_05241 [Drepanopeziza brunnea f. sp. 'multigermtubi' MB_m1]